MEYAFLFISLAVLIAVIFISVLKLGRFTRDSGPAVTEETEAREDDSPEKEGDPMGEYERTGIMHFYSEEEDGQDKPQDGLE